MIIQINKKDLEVLLILNQKTKNILSMTKQIDITYTHLLKILKEFEKKKIITMELIGRNKEIKLTTKGTYLNRLVKQLYEGWNYENINKI